MQRIKPFSRTRICTSVILGFAALIFALVTSWTEIPGNTSEVIGEVNAVIDRFQRANAPDAQGRISAERFLDGPSWEEVKTATYQLDWQNGRIARAKAMLKLNKNPESYSEYDWKNRFEDAQKSYVVCTTNKRFWMTVGFSALAVVVATPASWLLILLVSWLWYFVLDRVTEVSASIRGHNNRDTAAPKN